MKNLILILCLLFSSFVFAKGRIQNEDVKSEAELVSAGATKSSLINDTKIYVTGNGINDTFNNAVTNGLLGGVPAWASGTSYALGRVVYYTDNNIYKCTTANSDVVFTPANWQVLGPTTLPNTVTGTGTANTVSKFNYSGVIINSQITDDGTTATVANNLSVGKTLSVAGGKLTSLNRFDGSFEIDTSNFTVSTGTLTRESSIAMEGNYRGSWVTTAAGTLDTVAQTITATDTYELNALIDSSDSANVEICANINGSDNACKKILNRTGRQKASWIGQLNTGDSAKICVRYSGTNDTIKVDNFKYEPFTQQVASLITQDSAENVGASGVVTNISNGSAVTLDGAGGTYFYHTSSPSKLPDGTLLTYSNVGTSYFEYIAVKNCYVNASFSKVLTNGANHVVRLNSANTVLEAYRTSCAGYYCPAVFNGQLKAGEKLRFASTGSWSSYDHTYSINATASNDNVIQTWQDGMASTATYTMNPLGSVSNPVKGTNTLDVAQWYRDGEYAVINYAYRQTGAGTAGSGTFSFPIPSGLTIDTTKAALSAGASGGSVQDGTIVGYGSVSNTSASNTNYAFAMTMYAYSTTSVFGVVHGNSTSFQSYPFSSSLLSYSNAGLRIFFTVRVPILGWANGPTVLALPASLNNNKTYDSTQVTVTGAGWTPSFTKFIPYRTISKTTNLPVWRLNFLISGSGTTSQDYTGTISGVTFATTSVQQSINATCNSTSNSCSGYVESANGVFHRVESVSNTSIRISGDVELASKPTWADEWNELGVVPVNITPDTFVQTSGVINPVLFSTCYGGTTCTNTCTSGACYINQIGNIISNITRTASTGTYQMNFPKTYSKVNCTGNVHDASNKDLWNENCTNCSQLQFNTGIKNTSTNDTYGTLTCHAIP